MQDLPHGKLPAHAQLLELPATRGRAEGSSCSGDSSWCAYGWALVQDGGQQFEGQHGGLRHKEQRQKGQQHKGFGGPHDDNPPRILPRPLATYNFTFLIDSHVRGPFIPPLIKVWAPVSWRCSLWLDRIRLPK